MTKKPFLVDLGWFIHDAWSICGNVVPIGSASSAQWNWWNSRLVGALEHGLVNGG